ncbi:MAG: DUF859 family phage minor structural protein [Acutalibacteraceae bacterium]
MAIKFYGSCSGSSGSKYNIWLSVTENSQSIEDNSSNVTVKLYLKRNDGYSSSAYNLTASDNTAKLKVGSDTKVSKNLAIDTRNGVTVTLASWTGDVSHNADGTLSLALSGSFTMSGTSLTGGSVSGNFNCTEIPRASSLTLTKTSVNPEDTVGATITAASALFSHKVKWYIGSASVTHNLSAGVTSDVLTVPVSWAEQLTDAKKGKISIVLTTYKDTKKIGSKTYSLSFVIPSQSEYLPEFSLVTQRIDGDVPEDFEEYVKCKSKIKLDISGLELKYGASVSSYTATVDTTSKNAVPSTFDLNKAGNITVSVTVKDSRGFSVKKSQTVSVCDYSSPVLKINSLSRCDESGVKNTSGTRLLADFTPAYSSVGGKNIPKITYKYKKADSDTFSGEIELEESPCVLPDSEFLNNSSYTVAFKITDSITTDGDFFEREVSSSAIPFNIRNGGKGASFGCYAENDNELTVAWNLNVRGKLQYESLNVDFSDIFSEYRARVRYYPSMDIVFLRIRLITEETMLADTDYVVGIIDGAPTALFSPLNVRVGANNGFLASGGVKYKTGELIMRSEQTLNPGSYIYINGMYYADYNMQ